MDATGFFRSIVESQKRGEPRGICSIRSAHPFVLRAAMEQAAEDGLPLLVESTANQVNQFGGYAGMRPAEFRTRLLAIAEEVGFDRERIIVGGDHLGPLPWSGEPAATAMQKACGLVAESVKAGYRKIHLDASMPLSGDLLDPRGALDPGLAADREAEMAVAAEHAWSESRRAEEGAPVYVIGTEVPPPGGMGAPDRAFRVTPPDDLRDTVARCRAAFERRGLGRAWQRVIAVVAPIGLEYGDHDVRPYDRARARPLCRAVAALPGLVIEGHSTDHQSERALRELVDDGVAILKVGPALTFAMREALFGLELVERELAAGEPFAALSNLGDALERAMLDDPSHWKAYYRGDDRELRLARRFSLSDRSRYYWTAPKVAAAVVRLLENLSARQIPLTLISQYLPFQYRRVIAGLLEPRPRALVLEAVREALRPFNRAALGGTRWPPPLGIRAQGRLPPSMAPPPLGIRAQA